MVTAQAQTPVLIDDFGIVLEESQAAHAMSMRANALFSFKHRRDTLGVIINARRGRLKSQTIKDLKELLIKYREDPFEDGDYIIIDYRTKRGCCHARTNFNYSRFKRAIAKRPQVKYFAFDDPRRKKSKKEVFKDKRNIIKNTFFKYLNWNISEKFDVGGRVIVFPNKTFIRWYGEFDVLAYLDNIPVKREPKT